jgi:hypothetical protein
MSQPGLEQPDHFRICRDEGAVPRERRPQAAVAVFHNVNGIATSLAPPMTCGTSNEASYFRRHQNTSIQNPLVDLLGKPIADSNALCILTATHATRVVLPRHGTSSPGAGS